MKIWTSAFEDGGEIPQAYTCDGANVNPTIHISDAPKETKSFAFIVDDPDSPNGAWSHWVVWNISPETEIIVENRKPDNALVGKNDFGKNDYGGPCPASGKHRYFFKLYALDTVLLLGEKSEKYQIEKAMENHILDEAILSGSYER
tara:strand:- start:221 stop:658 length:438 start_codon:yes stop_codon:yes gene_type:complete